MEAVFLSMETGLSVCRRTLFERIPDEAFPPVIRPDRDNYCEREACE